MFWVLWPGILERVDTVKDGSSHRNKAAVVCPEPHRNFVISTLDARQQTVLETTHAVPSGWWTDVSQMSVM